MVKVETGLESAIEELRTAINECTAATRVTSTIVLGQSMNQDVTNPTGAAKVLRHLDSVERYVRSDVND